MASATITVTDDDQWFISAAAGEDHETVERDSSDLAWLTISRSADPNLTSGGATDTRYEIAVDFVLSGGVRGTDYDLLCGQSVVTSNTVSIPEGETSVGLSIRPKNDAVKEADVSVTLTITGASSSGVFDSGGSGCCCACWGAGGDFPVDENAGSASVTILDDDHWDIAIERTSAETILERSLAAAQFTVTRVDDGTGRSGDLSYGILVNLDPTGGSADFGTDFALYDDDNCYLEYWQMTIPVDDVDAVIKLLTNNDHLWESDEDAVIAITGGTSVGLGGGVFSADAFHADDLVYILDDDHWIVSLEEDGTPGSPRTVIAEEQTTSVDLTLKRTHEVMTPSRTGDTTYPIDVEFDYAGSKASGGDYVMIHKDKKQPDGSTADVEYGGGTVSFVIQKDNESETIELKAVDDTYVEYLHELLRITVTNATHGGQAYDIGTPDTVEIDIEDNDEFELHWAEFEDHLGMIADPSSGLDYSGHHWLDNNRNGVIEPAEGDKKLPVAYQSGNPVKETARFVGIIDPTYSGETLTFFANVSVDPANGAAGPPAPLAYKTFNVTAGSGEVVLSSVELTTLAANTARHFDDFNVGWMFQFAGESQALRGAGAQKNDLYATYQGALTGQYHTVIHLGSHFASGRSTLTTVIDAIWTNFEGLGVTTHDGQALHYYGLDPYLAPPPPVPISPNQPSLARQFNVGSVEQLLIYKDGKCGAWAHLLDDVFEAQGIVSDRKKFVVDPAQVTPPNGEQLLLRVDAGLAGQNTGSPKETIWPDHVVVLCNGTYYDPSYDKSKSTIQGLAKDAIVGYGYLTVVNGVPTYQEIEAADPTDGNPPKILPVEADD
mgnify:FL=1